MAAYELPMWSAATKLDQLSATKFGGLREIDVADVDGDHQHIQDRTPVGCPYRKSNPGILMMQSAQDWLADNTPRCIGDAWYRCILVQ
jgi:hypothetical protein